MTHSPTSLPASANVMPKTVPPNAPRPSREWLAGRVATFLSHYYQAQGPDPVLEAMMEDWVEVLRDLPQRAVELAVWERLRSDDRRRPIPGEIRRAARRYINFPSPPREEVESHLKLVTPERAAEIAAEVGGIASTMFRSPTETAHDIISQHVRDVFHVAEREIRSESRRPRIVEARFAIAHLLSKHTGMSANGVGKAVGTDHSTILHRLDRAATLSESDPDFGARLDEVERRLAK